MFILLIFQKVLDLFFRWFHIPDRVPATPARAPHLIPPAPFFIGQLLDDRYRIVGVLGCGGMGCVLEVTDTHTAERVALKTLRPDILDGDLRERFRREGEQARELNHPNIVSVHQYCEGEGDTPPYIVLALIPGGSLDSRLHGRPLSVRTAARLTFSLAQALQFAHERGYIHRDVKPSNVLLAGPAGASLDEVTPLLSDWGLLKHFDLSTITYDGTILGTLNYLSPEQAAGKIDEVRAASDVYSLSSLLYELLTGQPPFPERLPVKEKLIRIIACVAPDPRKRNPAIPEELALLCLRGLEKDPTDRPTAGEMAEALHPWTGHQDAV